MDPRGLLVGLLLEVVGEGERRHDAHGLGDPVGFVDEVARLGRDRRLEDVLVGDVLEQGREVDLLLEVGSKPLPCLLPDDRQDRHMVHLGIVEPVEEVDRARPRRGEADADLAGPLGVGAGHEGGLLLVAGLDEPDGVLGVLEAVQRARDPVDAVAWEPVDAADAPGVEAAEEEVGDGLAHDGGAR